MLLGAASAIAVSAVVLIILDNRYLPAKFQFEEEKANPLYSLSQCTGDFEIDMYFHSKSTFGIIFKFIRNGSDLFIYPGHTGSVFCTNETGRVLFLAAFARSDSGCTLLAYDLETGKELWKTRLQALEPTPHSAYRNEVNLRIGPGTVSVHGRETYGDYIEVLDQRTGRTLAHRVYRDERGKKKVRW